MSAEQTTSGTFDEAGLWSRFTAFLLGPVSARRVWFLTLAMIASALALNLTVVADFARPAVSFHLSWWLFVVVVAAIEYPEIRLFIRNEGHSFTLGELSLCLGLFVVMPQHLALAAGLGAALSKLKAPPIKIAFNAALWTFQTTLALILFHAIGDAGDPFGSQALVATFAAMVVVGVIGATAVWAAISLAQGRISYSPLGIAATIAMAVNIANTGLGLIGVYLIAQAPHLLLALIGPIAVLFLAYHAFVVEHQRHQRLQVVYRTTRSILEAPEIGAALEAVLTQARDVFRSDIAQVVLYPDRADEGIVVHTLGPGDRTSVTSELGMDKTVFAAVELTRRAEVLGEGEISYRGGLVGIDSSEVRGVIIAPLEGERRVLGAIAVANRLGDATPYDAVDLQLLETLAGHAGVAIGNGRLERTLDELTELQVELSERATQDALTGLANRAHFAHRLQTALDARTTADVGVIYVDLDDFKSVNDTYGHHAGDLTLTELGSRLRSCLRGDDLAGRLGGDEFAVLVHRVESTDQLSSLADRIRVALERPIHLAEGVHEPGLSLGLALAGDVVDCEELLALGDAAMYHAKRSGKGRSIVYDVAMRDAEATRADMVDAIEAAVSLGQLVVHYQPIVSLADREVTAVEALVRWNRPGVGLLAPGEFMPIAEQAGLAPLIGEWVIREACGQVARWNLGGVGRGALGVHVNVSVAHASDPELEMRVVEAVHAAGLPADCLTLEITEQVLAGPAGGADERLASLRSRGVTVALDDFGTGVSSLARLGEYPVDLLKIPGAFVGTDAAESSPCLADALVTIGRTLDIPTVAEMIETPEQVARLTALGCEYAQGHAFARAMPAAELELWLLAGGAVGPVRPAADLTAH